MSQQRVSAGLLMCRRAGDSWEFLIAHPGGPFFAKKDEGAWTLPKGLVNPDEELLAAARREFREETGFDEQATEYFSLGMIVQKGGKRVHAWAFVGTCDPTLLSSNTFELPWPPRSGKTLQVPELDRVAFYDAETAKRKLLAEQGQFIDRALAALR